jgi:hypothetical protein
MSLRSIRATVEDRFEETTMRQELTLKSALADPLVRTVMAADGVDPEELSAMLSGIVSTLDHAQLRPSRARFAGATNCC